MISVMNCLIGLSRFIKLLRISFLQKESKGYLFGDWPRDIKNLYA